MMTNNSENFVQNWELPSFGHILPVTTVSLKDQPEELKRRQSIRALTREPANRKKKNATDQCQSLRDELLANLRLVRNATNC